MRQVSHDYVCGSWITQANLWKLSLCFGLILFCTSCGRNEEAAVRVVIETAFGDVEMEVYTALAPLSSEAFLRYVDSGSYSANGGFYRAVRPENDQVSPKINVLQGGLLPSERWANVPGIAHESTEQTGLAHVNGALSLGRRAIGTADGTRFFICIGAQPVLDYGGERNSDRQGFAVFGRVVKGMAIVRKIHGMRTESWPERGESAAQFIRPPVRILKAYRVLAD